MALETVTSCNSTISASPLSNHDAVQISVYAENTMKIQTRFQNNLVSVRICVNCTNKHIHSLFHREYRSYKVQFR